MTVCDRWVYRKHWLQNWLAIAGMILRHGPFDMLRELRAYPWIWHLLKVNRLLRTMTEGRTGRYREAVAHLVTHITRGIVGLLEGFYYDRGRMVLTEDLVPPEIFHAMGLKPWMAEAMGIIVPIVEPPGMQGYVDIAENEGVPPDICSLPKATIGMALAGHLPPVKAVVASNLPCDGGMASYTIITRKCGAPAFYLDVPHHFRGEEAVRYFSAQLREMIRWLEERTPGRMDWERLKDICETRNRLSGLELDLWDMMRRRPAPMAAEAVYLSHLWCFNLFPGSPGSVRLFERLTELCAKNIREGTPALPHERRRALLWNPPTLHAVDLFAWAERRHGVSLIMDSMTYNRQPFIDTSTPDSMLMGLARIIMDGPMVRHTRGPAENYLNDILFVREAYDIDMLWVAGHIGCKNTQALYGMLREMCRRKGLPLLIIDYDLLDSRIETRDGILRQVDRFMENIMGAGG
jgi:hypothetical protein